MAIITLTSDLGLQDYYVASVKGAILKELPDANIIDISHEIPPFDLQKSAFVIRNSYLDFPEGTIHIIGINSDFDLEHPHVVVYANGHYFIGADNGIFSLITDTPPEKAVELTISQDTDNITFPTKDVFVKAACHIARGGTMEIIGKPYPKLSEKAVFRAVSENNLIKGMVIYIDHYGNVVTNITIRMFKEFGKNRPFKLFFRGGEYDIDEISKSYNSVVEGEKLALFSSTGNIEIAINKGSAKELFNIKIGDIIRIEFYD
ncbi:MAG: SAM-dependent chlorinase/fluorinase [Flavobacteriales bacterium]|nr:SAM-dependent chlorinase/fluorinase [Flavobacteriales bacterium]